MHANVIDRFDVLGVDVGCSLLALGQDGLLKGVQI